MRSDLLVFNERNKATLSALVTLSLCVSSFKLSLFEFGFANAAQSLVLNWTTLFCCFDGAYIGPNLMLWLSAKHNSCLG